MLTNEIRVRTMGFAFPEVIEPVIIEGDPEESYFLLGISLLLPYLEPYLIRTMRQAKGELHDPVLVEELDRFCRQEGQHYRQHIRFNKSLRLSGFPGLAEIEAEMDADYRRFSEEKSLRFNLAYAEGFEALTTALALYLFEDRGRRPIESNTAELMYWHLIEELEHRTVAFDVYEAVCGDYPYRLAVGLYAQQHLVQFALRVTMHMLRADPARVEALGGRAAANDRMRERVPRLATKLLPRVLRTYLPGYTPHNIVFAPWMQQIADEYASKAKRVS